MNGRYGGDFSGRTVHRHRKRRRPCGRPVDSGDGDIELHAQRHSYFVQRGDGRVGNTSFDLGNIGLVNAGCLGKLFLRVALFRSGGEDRLTDRYVRRRRQFPDRLTFLVNSFCLEVQFVRPANAIIAIQLARKEKRAVFQRFQLGTWVLPLVL